MKELTSTIKDRIREFVADLTITDVTPDGMRVKSIDCERSHRGAIYSPTFAYWTNVVIKFHEEDMKNYMNRKNITLPVPDALISMVNEGNPPKIEHVFKCIISGALRKSGFYDESYALPETDKALF